MVGAGHFRRAAPQGYYHPGAAPQGAPRDGAGHNAPGGRRLTVPPTAPPPVDCRADARPPRAVRRGGRRSAAASASIDNALPMTQFRLRYDSAYGNNRPDRANFFYAKCGCFGSPNAVGPPLPETSVDSQTLYSYVEYAITPRLSVFGNVPVRFINPEQNRNAAGISDLQFGGKYALVYDPNRVLSVQLQVIVPTGDTRLGLGSGSTWLEPGLLYQEQLSDRWRRWFGQLKDQIPLTRVSDFAGNVLTYGLGTSYRVAEGSWGYARPGRRSRGLDGPERPRVEPGQRAGRVGQRGHDREREVRRAVRLGRSDCDGPYPTRSNLYIGCWSRATGEVVVHEDMFGSSIAGSSKVGFRGKCPAPAGRRPAGGAPMHVAAGWPAERAGRPGTRPGRRRIGNGMTHRPGLLLVVLAYVGFVSLGLPDAVFGVAWPSVRDRFGLTQAAAGVVFAASASGTSPPASSPAGSPAPSASACCWPPAPASSRPRPAGSPPPRGSRCSRPAPSSTGSAPGRSTRASTGTPRTTCRRGT